jgi:hypothetical protein
LKCLTLFYCFLQILFYISLYKKDLTLEDYKNILIEHNNDFYEQNYEIFVDLYNRNYNDKEEKERINNELKNNSYIGSYEALDKINYETFNTKLYWGWKYMVDGLYLGQMNYLGDAQGRGMIVFNNLDRGALTCLWVNNVKFIDCVHHINGKETFNDDYLFNYPCPIIREVNCKEHLVEFTKDNLLYNKDDIEYRLNELFKIVKMIESDLPNAINNEYEGKFISFKNNKAIRKKK